MAKIQWITYEGNRILMLDFTHRAGARAEELVREVQQVVTSQAPASVLVLADFTGASFDEEVVRQIATTLAVDRPYVRRAAWVGSEGLSEEWFKSIRDFRNGKSAASQPGRRHCNF